MGGRNEPKLANERLVQGLALSALLVMGGWCLFGPSGVLAWSDNTRQLTERQQQLKQVSAQRDVLKNRVALLDPAHVDPDIAGELLRSNLNVVHQDEMVMMLGN